MSDTSLTLHARGPAEVETTHEHDGMTVTETHEIELDATIDLEDISEFGDVYRQGFVISAKDIAHHVTDSVEGDGDRTIRPLDASDWELTTEGRVRDYIDVAVRAAKKRRATSSDSKVATLAAHICANFAEEFATDDRPRLALLDLINQLDVDDFAKADVIRGLDGAAAIEPDAEPTATAPEVEADD